MVHHGADRPDREPGVLGLAHVEDEDREPVGALAFVLRRGAREQQHQVGIFRTRGPDLLAVDHVVVAVAARHRLDRRGVGAARRLGHPERLQAQRPGGDLGQVFALLLGIAVPQQRPHDVHLGVAGGAVAAGALDFLQDRGGRRDRQAGAAIFLRDQRREIAGRGDRFDECGGIGTGAIELAPIFAGKIGAQPAHAVADLAVGVVVTIERFHHDASRAST